MLFHQGNASVHLSVVAIVKLDELSYELLSRLPYSPNLAPNDYLLKKTVGGKIFCSDDENIVKAIFFKPRQVI